MRKFIIFLLLAAGAVWIYRHPVESRTHMARATRVAADYMRQLSDKWHPEGEAVQDQPEAPIQLPPDVYVAREAIPYMGSAGAATISAGTELRKVGEGTGKLVLTNGPTQVIVDHETVTRDPHEVSQLRKRALEIKNSLLSQSRTKLEAELDQVTAEIKITSKELAVLQERDAIAKSRGLGIGMATSPDFVRTKINRLEARAAELRKEIARIPASASPTAAP